MTVPLTPAQTVGPFFGHALSWSDGPNVVPADHPGAIRVHGRVFDGAAEPVPDALVETWQADGDGHFHAGFRGFGRCATDEHGRYHVRTVKPGVVPGRIGRLQAPHIDVSVFARGLLHRLVTRIYFPDEPAANAADPVLSAIADPVAVQTLIAHAEGDMLRFDVHLQGPHETVFFAI